MWSKSGNFLTTVLVLVCLIDWIASEPRWGWSRRRRQCYKQNCVPGQWSNWSPCSQSCGPHGHSRRSRLIVKPASCGGTCLVTTIGAKACNRFCLNGGTLIRSSCYCKAGYSGECCERVTGGWTSWGAWCACSKTCGRGTQHRTRTCTKPGGTGCVGIAEEYRSCIEKQCNLDGAWSSWLSWGQCTGSCGSGIQTRKRSCTNPSPSYGGKKCSGPAEQHKNCFLQRCPVNGGWSGWGAWGRCSKTCGYGSQSRRRYCNNPAPGYGGKACVGPSISTRRCCIKSHCPVNGGWSAWRPWSKCSKTCGAGLQYTSRYCNNPTPKHGGKTCVGPSRNTRTCNAKSCAADGGWSPWGLWCKCSKTCSTGLQYRTRSCTKPRPGYGGKPCSGPDKQTRICNTRICPVNGRWALWARWSACSKTCGTGSQTRRRTCSNPPPQHGGKQCKGPSVQTKSCSVKTCPMNGRWALWARWSACSKTCGTGSQTRRRTCSNPPPQHGGKQCKGPSVQTKSCSVKTCPMNGRWALWARWSACSKTCGTGSQTRRRTCSNPPPQNGGKQCKGPSVQTKSCSVKTCPTDGGWSAWDKWSSCSKTCATGSQHRSRTCTNPSPAHGGKQCSGQTRETRNCNTNPCPVNGRWALWTRWSACSKTCGSGSQTRKRTCSNPPPQHGGKQCKGPSVHTKSCLLPACPAYGGWGSWGAWSVCSKSCGTGSQNRTRSCHGDSPGQGQCPGSDEQTHDCNTENCPVVNGGWGEWTQWSSCSRSCGPGTRIRTRRCDNPSPGPGGSPCMGPSVGSRACDLGPCAGNCWSDWSNWSQCTKACGCGKQFRVRFCNCAHGQGHDQCQGPGENSQSCNCNACPNGPPPDAFVED